MNTSSLMNASQKREDFLALGSLVVLAISYACLAEHFSRFHAFWSADSGARFAMIDNWRRHGSLTVLHYDGASVDPTAQIHPLQFYVIRGVRGFHVIYPPLFPWLSGWAFRLWGFRGLAFVPLTSGLAAIGLTYAMARRLALKCRALLPLVMGLATPVIVYSVVFWDHALLMLLTAAVAYLVLRALEGRSPTSAVAAGLTLGLGIWVHELFLLLAAAVLCASLPWLREAGTRRLFLGLASSFSALLLLWLIGNQSTYGSWGGAHLTEGVRWVETQGSGRDDLNKGSAGLRRSLAPGAVAERARLQLTGASSYKSWGVVLLLLVGLIPLVSLFGRAAQLVRPWLYLAGAVAAACLIRCWVPESGLFQVTPLLLPALAVPWLQMPRHALTSSEPTSEEKPPMPCFYAWMSRVCGVFALLVLVNPVVPGMDWGSRYLLTVLPLLVLLAARAIETQSSGAGREARRSLALVLTAMIGISVVSQCCGLAAVRNDLIYSQDLNRKAGTLAPVTLATDVFWLGPELTASSLPQPQFLVRTDSDRQLFLSGLRRNRTTEFNFMGTQEGYALLAQAAAQANACFRPVAAWNDIGMEFAHFEGQPRRVPRPKRVLALYYPWYGTPERSGDWMHQEPVEGNAKKLADHVHFPAFGPYDSNDPAIVERHLKEAQAAGIDTLVCSWWGQKDRTDSAIRLVLKAAAAHSMKVCVLWEHLSAPNDPKAASSDLTYLLGTLAKNPSYLHEGGKPVIFLYSGTSQGLSLGQWTSVVNQATTQLPPGVQLIGTAQTPADILLLDGFFTFNTSRPMAGGTIVDCVGIQSETYRPVIALARKINGISVESVIPGYDDRHPDDATGTLTGSVLDRSDGKLYGALWEQAIKDDPDWVLVNSFNQWHNGTEIEPSVEMGDRYVGLTRQFALRFKKAAATGGGKTPPAGTKAAGR